MKPAPEGRKAGAGEARSVSFRFSTGSGRHRVWGAAFLSHGGLVVNLVGGDRPHVGAVAVSLPRPSLRAARRWSATTSVLAVPGHKEDELARPFAAELARALRRTAVVVAGIHIRRARPEDIERVVENAGRALEAIIATVRGKGRAEDQTSRDGGKARRISVTRIRGTRSREQA